MMVTAMRSPLVLSAAPAPAPTPPDKEPQAGAAAHPFAEMLRQNRAAEAPHDAASAQAAAPTGAKDRRADAGAGPEASASGAAPAQRDAGRAKARSADASRSAARSDVAPARSTPVPEGARSSPDEHGVDAAMARADAAATPGTTSLARPEVAQRIDPETGARATGTAAHVPGANAAPRGLDTAAEARSAGTIALDAAEARSTAASAASESRRPEVRAAADATTARGDARPGHDLREAGAFSLAELLAESTPAAHRVAAPIGEDRAPGAAALPAQGAEPPRNLTQSADAVAASATLAAPVDSADFATAFGVHVSTFARAGIQHAELHLNPAEMGPVSIQITLDGTQARVDFGADAAATRHAIEAGLPELASALRDAGFTLAGGGVAQHSRSNDGHADDADPKDSGARRAAPGPVARLDAAAQRVTRQISAGGVDLYA